MVYIKKTIAGIGIIACVALCAAVCPRSAEVGDLPAEPINAAVPAEIEARPEGTPHINFSADMPTPVAEVIAESEPQKAEITTEKETEKPAPTQTAQSVKPNASPTEPHNGDVRVVDGDKNQEIRIVYKQFCYVEFGEIWDFPTTDEQRTALIRIA